MFDIRYYFCRRGGENIHGMTKDTFELYCDPETKLSYVKKVVDEMQKNHHESDSEIITGHMPEMKTADGNTHPLCPVKSFYLYTEKLHPDNNSLWQRPAKNFPKDESKPWFEKTTVGHNTHEKFMSTISTKANLSKRYTNHCIRVTGITNLTRANFNVKQIMAVSGHKSVESLALYQRVQSNEKLVMGMSLSYCPSPTRTG